MFIVNVTCKQSIKYDGDAMHVDASEIARNTNINLI